MFIDNGDGTVTDQRTGLMWQKDTAPGTYSWQNAMEYCEKLDLAGHTDWRLPNEVELRGIVACPARDPAINAVFEAVSEWYWTSSGWSTVRYVICVDFYNGNVQDDVMEECEHRVRAVRGR